jgi:RNase P subunit RPR2
MMIYGRYIDWGKEVILMQAYCFKCRRKIEMKNVEKVTLKNGRPAIRGTCSVCGTKVFRIGKA